LNNTEIVIICDLITENEGEQEGTKSYSIFFSSKNSNFIIGAKNSLTAPLEEAKSNIICKGGKI